MFADTANLSFYLGIIFIALTIAGFTAVVVYVRNNGDINKIEKVIDLGKWVITAVAIALSAAIVNDGFKEREHDVKEMEVFERYISTVTKAGDIEQRWLLTEYFAAVSPNGEFRKAWLSYKAILKPDYDDYRKSKQKIAQLVSKDSLTNKDVNELYTLQNKAQTYAKSLVGNTSSSDGWIVVTSTDKTLQEAQFEVKKAARYNYTASIYKKGSLYRTAVLYTNREDAEVNLDAIRTKLNKSAFIVSLFSWCPNTVSNGECLECR